eukprot:GAHX01001108.1.p1 GENE.GAHX01001108.1~~GAHX01001108.1.p1  ORF type:complete len:228 (+),score=32.68 GAHX01001108.1:648-1331(+)
MYNFAFVCLLLTGFLTQTELQTERTEVLFSHPRENIQLPERLTNSDYSDAFKLALIAMKVYSLVKTNIKMIYAIKLEDFRKFSKQDNSIFRALHQLTYREVCVKYGYYTHKCICHQFKIQIEIVCKSKITFRKIKRGFSMVKLIEKSKGALIAVYLMRRKRGELKYFDYEMAILLEIKKTITIDNEKTFKCVYINTLNEIKTMHFKINEGRFVGESVFILEPWYYIE